MAENLQKFNDTKPQIQEVERTPSRINATHKKGYLSISYSNYRKPKTQRKS